jgi:hypothetical protein
MEPCRRQASGGDGVVEDRLISQVLPGTGFAAQRRCLDESDNRGGDDYRQKGDADRAEDGLARGVKFPHHQREVRGNDSHDQEEPHQTRTSARVYIRPHAAATDIQVRTLSLPSRPNVHTPQTRASSTMMTAMSVGAVAAAMRRIAAATDPRLAATTALARRILTRGARGASRWRSGRRWLQSAR